MRFRILTAAVALVVLGVSGWVIGDYFRLDAARSSAEESWSRLDNMLLLREDRLTSLAETLKGSAIGGSGAAERIARARERLSSAGTASDRIDAACAVDSTLDQLLVLAGRDAQLRGNEVFVHLEEEMVGLERRLADLRQRYNERARSHNALVHRFPARLFNPRELPEYPEPAAADRSGGPATP